MMVICPTCGKRDDYARTANQCTECHTIWCDSCTNPLDGSPVHECPNCKNKAHTRVYVDSVAVRARVKV